MSTPDAAAARSADAVVVGAGIVGAACAWRLAERGLSVLVLEGEAVPAAGSTGRSAAGVRHQFSEAVNVLLSQASIAEYRAMPEARYDPIGYLFYVPDDAWDAQMAAVRIQRSLGVDVEVLAVADAARRVPVDARGLAGATFCAADGRVDPHGICLEYLRRARSLGAGVRLASPVEAIERDGALWRLRCARAEFTAPFVVNAAGAWAGEVAALAGLDVPVTPARRVVYATAPPAPSPALPAIPCPLTIDLATGVWFRSEGARLIFGLANPAERGFAQGIDWEWLETTYEAALAHFPWFERLSIDRRASWWGYYEMTPDHDAVLGPMPDAPGWLNACGFSGHGVQHAAAVGRLVAQWAAGEPGFIDASALSIERFCARPGAAPTAGERLVV